MDMAVMAAWIGGVGVPLVAIIGGFLVARYEKMQAQIDDAKAQAYKAQRELQEYKLVVAEKYVSITYLKDVETRIIGALENMGRRFDEFVDSYHNSNRPSR